MLYPFWWLSHVKVYEDCKNEGEDCSASVHCKQFPWKWSSPCPRIVDDRLLCTQATRTSCSVSTCLQHPQRFGQGLTAGPGWFKTTTTKTTTKTTRLQERELLNSAVLNWKEGVAPSSVHKLQTCQAPQTVHPKTRLIAALTTENNKVLHKSEQTKSHNRLHNNKWTEQATGNGEETVKDI